MSDHDLQWSVCACTALVVIPKSHRGQHVLLSFAGTLPASWGDSGAFPALSLLQLYDLPISGMLPATWGSHGSSMPSMTALYLGAEPRVSQLSGLLSTKGVYINILALALAQ